MPPQPNPVNQMPALRVLIVDDAAGMRVYLRSILASAGYQCVEATDGGAAFDLLLKDRFDLVITDLNMPQMDGFALLSAISLLPRSRGRPPVIVCSALLASDEVQKRPELRLASVLLAKPVQPEDVLKAVAKARLAQAGCR
ncbi:MAG TPA: response regulator [Hyphomonadaceae bacterium]|nr:response regulator [Hyphomonadaceae bacterium]